MVAPVLIFGIGNVSRGDDALGPMLLHSLNADMSRNGRSEHFELLEEFQLQVEHAMDMQGRQLVLLIDAGMDTPAPFAFYRSPTREQPVVYSHALAPEFLPNVYKQLYQEEPPAIFVLCVRGERFELGDELTPQAEEHLAEAYEFGRKLLYTPDLTAWDSQCTQSSMTGLLR